MGQENSVIVENQTDIELRAVASLGGINYGESLLGATAPGAEIPAVCEIGVGTVVRPDIFFTVTLYFSEFHKHHTQYRERPILKEDFAFTKSQRLVVYFGQTGELRLKPEKEAWKEIRERDKARAEGRVRMRVHCPKCRTTLLSPEGALRFKCHSCKTTLSLPDYKRPAKNGAAGGGGGAGGGGRGGRGGRGGDGGGGSGSTDAVAAELDAEIETVRGNLGGNFEGVDSSEVVRVGSELWV